MATTYKTPGVYVEEIPKLPPSVAQVETAIPAFIGYTKQAEKNGENLTNKPTRISSLLEFESLYAGASVPGSITVTIDTGNNNAVTAVTAPTTQRYMMYDALRLFFDNGGGDCYIVSVGAYGSAPALGTDSSGLRGGIKVLEKFDEPTIILIPDAVQLSSDSELFSLQQFILAQCAKLQDRVGVFDLMETTPGVQQEAVDNFRDHIGINDLKYGAAYTPWVHTTYPRDVDFTAFRSTVVDTGNNPVDLGTLSSDSTLNDLVATAVAASSESALVAAVIERIRKASTSTGALNVALTPEPTMKDMFRKFKQAVDAATDEVEARSASLLLFTFLRAALLEFQTLTSTLTTTNLANDLNAYAASPTYWRGAATTQISLERNADVRNLTGLGGTDGDINGAYTGIDAAWLGVTTPSAVSVSAKDYGDTSNDALVPGIARMVALDAQAAFNILAAFADAILSAANTYKKGAQDALYEKHPIIGNMVRAIKKELSRVPPSGAIAGVYARVDNTRGVWKAPANESLVSVSGPSVNISHEEQERLNVDAVAGKSINAIRAFTGKGTLVWGARTLAGNDNEWRYVSVRRFFNMVEESCKKATEPFVFEPNDANTWIKVQAMIENFLTLLWRQGALQGAKPEHAFYVAVGLGKTMTAVDILEGRMIVEIGMAVVRPAEFIILQFSHKMAES
jgi:uncharacterized protein